MLGAMFGFLNVRKPAGPTSHDIVARVRRRLPRKIKVGHAGTLDPFADGVLVLCLGAATRLAEYVQRQPKRYTARIRLGATSTTDDSEGQVTSTPSPRVPDLDDIQSALARFVGAIQQTPPAHSAVHVQGKRAYALARAGQPVMPAPRTVTIHSLNVLRYDWPELDLEIGCGSGTYIRALARDLGAVLGCGGYCSTLRRVSVGQFVFAQAVSPEAVDLRRDVIAPETMLDLPTVRVCADDAEALRHGRGISVEAPCPPPGPLALLDEAGRLVAVAQTDPQTQRLQPSKVFPPRGNPRNLLSAGQGNVR